LLAGHPGGIWLVGEEGASLVLEAPGVDLHSVLPTTAGGDGVIRLLRAGRLSGRRLAAGGLEEVWSSAVPLGLSVAPWGLVLESPRAWRLGDRVAVGPLSRGRVRLETAVVAADGVASSVWSLVPAGFRVSSSRALELGAATILALVGGEKLGVFVDAEVLVHSLAPDPTRRGHAPLGRLATPCPIWNEPEITSRAVAGVTELLVACAKGLVGDELWVGAWPAGVGGRPGAGRFVDLGGEPLAFAVGPDLDADGIGDAVVLGEDGKLLLYAGRARGRPFEREATSLGQLRVPVEGQNRTELTVGTNAARLANLDGIDAQLFVASGDGGRPRVVAALGSGSAGREALVATAGD
jgi:hypothetical protein